MKPMYVSRSWQRWLAVWSLCQIGLVGTLLASNTITYAYDALGRLTFVSDPVNGNRDYDYDKAGNRLNVATGTASDSASEPGGGGPTYISITSSTGTILPAAASLYMVASYCNGQPASCTWRVQKLYGDQGVVVVVVHAPNGVNPACNNGVTQQLTSGYTRAGCVARALSTVYGQ